MRRGKCCTSAARLRSVVADQSGSAALEFVAVGTLMLVPLIYLVLALGMIQGQSLGTEAAARHLARSVSTASDTTAAGQRTEEVLTAVVEEYGLDEDALTVRTSCRPSPGPCPAAGATLTVTVATRVSLPLVPPVLGADRFASIPIEAVSVQKVSRFWGAG